MSVFTLMVGLWFLFVGISGILFETKVIRAGRVEKTSWLMACMMEWQRKPLMKRDRSVDPATFWAITISMILMYVCLLAFGVLQLWLTSSNFARFGNLQ